MEQELFLAGLALVMAGFLLILLASAGSSNIDAGGVIFLGPLPVPFGDWRLALAGIVIGAVMLVLYYSGMY